jgi:polysaccharide pyruvyl transferase CsaB
MQIAIFGSYGQGNIGDEAIADGLAKVIKKAYPKSTLVLFSHQHPSLNDTHPDFETIRPMIASGLRSFWSQLRSGAWQKNIETLKTCDIVMIGGGGIFHDQEVDQKGLSPLFIWWLRTILFKLLGKPIAIATVGIGPIKRGLSHWWLKGIFKRAKIITVRDQSSQELAQRFTNKSVTILPDPVWGLLPTPNSKQSSGILGINIRANHRFTTQQLLEQLIDLIDSAMHQTKFRNILLIPFAQHQPDDRDIMNELAPLIKDHTHLPVTVTHCSNTLDAYNKVAQCDYFIATRFHSYIFAKSADIPCLLLSYSEKTDQITKHEKVYYLEQQKLAIAFWHQKLLVD